MTWLFFEFVDHGGRRELQTWVGNMQPRVAKEVAATMKAKLEIARKLPLLRFPLFAQLAGEEGIIEMRFKAAGTQWRPLGCYGPGDQMSFTFLVGAKEVGGAFVPRSAPGSAGDRRGILTMGRVAELWLLQTEN